MSIKPNRWRVHEDQTLLRSRKFHEDFTDSDPWRVLRIQGEFVEGFHPDLLCTVPASELALKHVGRPLPNAALLGGFAAVCDQVRLESVFAAIREKFAGKVAEGNVAAAREAYDIVKAERQEALHHA